jgi:hypothetical protein
LARSTRRIALLALAGLAACSEPRRNNSPPFDRFYYPTGIALTTIETPQGKHTGLVVLSSNFDLRYDVANGGTVLVVDVDETLAGSGSPLPLAVVGATQVGSFGGQLAILDSTTCPDVWVDPTAMVLATSRSQDALYAIEMAPDGSLTCDPSRAPCKVPLEPTLGDPFDVAIACGSFPEPVGTTEQEGFASADHAYAFVTYGQSANSEGWLSRLDMLAGDPAASRKQIDLGLSQSYAAIYDQGSARLFVTSRFASVGFNPLRWFGVAVPRLDAELAPLGPSVLDVGAVVSGSDSRGMAISSDGERAYLALRMYDVDAATSLGGRPAGDVSGALAVIDLTDLSQGGPARVLSVVPLDRGPAEVKVIPRAGQRDLVAVTSSDDSALTLYDDQVGEIARVFGLCGSEPDNANAPQPCDTGEPLLGKQPFGLAVQPGVPDATHARLFVGSFDQSWVNVIDIDPSQPQAAPSAWRRIGPERQ